MPETRYCAYRFCDNELPPETRPQQLYCCVKCSERENRLRDKEEKARAASNAPEITALALAAKAAGMTYGEYVARISGRIR